MSLTLKISCVANPPLPGQRLYAEAIAYSQPQPSYAKRHHQRHVYLRILSFINQCFAFPSGKVTPRWSSSDISLTLTPRKGSRGKCRRPPSPEAIQTSPDKVPLDALQGTVWLWKLWAGIVFIKSPSPGGVPTAHFVRVSSHPITC